ncbi:uncharacterized protein [Diadema antillarum]|uniref:uncharacterized protein n=1 Tax=Diadema antillarum TaxID=105358 RepID=UPI003A846A06
MYFEGSVLLLLVICSASVNSQQQNGFNRELPQFNKEPFNFTAFVGETARLTCSVSHLAGNQAVAWMKLNPTSSFLTSGTQSFSSEPGKLSVVGEHNEGNLQFDLLINNITENDAGEYICTVVEFGELNYRRWRRSQTATVTVIKPTPKPTLKCIADPHASHLHSGVHLRLGCKLDGAGPRDTRISMNWTRNENMVVSRTRFDGIQFGAGKPSPDLLHVFKVTTRDQGDVYTCSVEYDHHNGTRWITVQDQCHLKPLHVKPYSNLILSRRAIAAVDVGQEVRFVCPTRTPKAADPGLRAFTWNIVPTISPSRFRLSHHGDELIIHRILPEDHGLKVSCFIPPMTAGTSKRELYLRVRHPDSDLLWEPKIPEVVPFGPVSLVGSSTSSTANNSRASSNQSTTNSPATETPIQGLNDSLTVNSGVPRAYPMYSAGNTEFLLTPDTNQTQTNETNEPVARVGNLTINFQLIPSSLVTEPSNILSPISSSSSVSSSSSSSSSVYSRSHFEGGTGDTDGTAGDTDVVMEGGDPFVDSPSYHDYHYDIDLIGQNINRTAIAPSDLSSSDFIFIFVMIAEVILTVLLVVLLLVTGPVCFASKRNKDQDDTNDTDVEKAAPPMPLVIAPKKEASNASHGSEVAIVPKDADMMTSDKGNSAPRLTKKEVPTVDITLSFEMKGQRREDRVEKRSVPTVSESVKDEQESDTSTVEFTTFGYPRSENSSEA